MSACWVGGEDRDIHLNQMTYAQGASSALPIWAYYMRKVFRDEALGYTEDEQFNLPEDFDPCGNRLPTDSVETVVDETPPPPPTTGVDVIFD